jgi:8-oxo-dGTP pyrophosphatase MutT (NUDIX family)
VRMPVPDALRSHVGRTEPPAPTRDAATVVVVRDGDEGIEAYLLRRQPTMAFAPGVYVFPGGGVDDPDRGADMPWAGPPPAVWAERFGCSEHDARGLVCAAVRETFEESGVLLAGPDEHSVVADTSAATFQEARLALERREMTFGSYLADSGLVLRTDLLGAWAHWITPTFEPRRYDTRFFVAVLPQGQSVGELPGEADHAAWVPLTQVLAAVDAGGAAMLPPTHITCREIAGLTASEVLTAAASRTIRPIEPQLVEIDGEMFLDNDPGDDA